MALDRPRAKQCLKSFDFRSLFTQELGWDKYSALFPVTISGESFPLQAVAEKRGVVVFVSDQAPDYATRLKIEKQVAKFHFEHIIVFTDKDRGRQIWQWVRRESGRPLRAREHKYDTSQSGELLIQKLENVLVTLEEEEAFTLGDVTRGLRAGFDVEKVTKRFYDGFKTEHKQFLKFIKGIPDHEMEGWYASVMINRLMFLYFIQAKSFLDGNPDYLRAKLAESKSRGSNRYYREFLYTLFFEGFARKPEDRPPAVRKLLGDIPYLNGGLFQRHQIEELHGKRIEIADAAFDKLFTFFREYQWHLDERVGQNDREINPDVLGYIFEKYINQKQMGAYYTKEDITEYISKNTIIPFLFDAAKKKCAVAFEPGGYIWRLCRENPDRYIYEAIRRGHDRELPSHIAAGLDDVSKRDAWNQSTPYGDEPENFLPTETWREFVERRQRYCDLTAALSSGEVSSINDFVTLNLDVRQFAEDVIQYSEGPELVRAFYKAISAVSVLDPTCGSGAFLFAALNILKPLYEACLKRMAAFVEEYDAAGGKSGPEKYKDFREILIESAKHSNQDYFVVKSIIVNNLYGVDIMEEAVEICKLRLFLKLVAQVDTVERIEPLPDIDFNIRAGNTLVGYARYEDVQKAVGSKLDFGGAMEKIEDRARILDSAMAMFRQQQTKLNGSVTVNDKHELRHRFDDLAAELNDYLSGEYNRNTKAAIAEWRHSHRPFHWFSEFHGIISRGFDVIIGNPPYVEISKVRSQYSVRGFATESCGNLYALCVERSLSVAGPHTRLGLVLQQPVVSTLRMRSARDLLTAQCDSIWASTYDDRPSKLFDGIHHSRIAIILANRNVQRSNHRLYVTSYLKWHKEERSTLFARRLVYVEDDFHRQINVFPKRGTVIEARILSKVLASKQLFIGLLSGTRTRFNVYYKITGVGHWFTITLRSPRFKRDGKTSTSTREETMSFVDQRSRDCGFAVLNSSLFYWFYQLRTNCRDFNPSDFKTFPVPPGLSNKSFAGIAERLQKTLDEASTFSSVSHSKTGAIQVETFRPRTCKHTIDRIDEMLATHYGFSPDERDFIINYDVKYRLGRDAAEE